MDSGRFLSIVTSCVADYRVRQGLTLKVKPAQGKTANPKPAEFQALPLSELPRGPSDSAPTDSLQEFCIHRIHTGICVCVCVGGGSGFLLHSPSPYLRGSCLYYHSSVKPSVCEPELGPDLQHSSLLSGSMGFRPPCPSYWNFQ